MTEYSIGFSKNLISAAEKLIQENENSLDSERAILYLSLLASEVLLKSILERVGVPIDQLKSMSHNIPDLLNKVCQCTYYDASLGVVPAVRLRAITLNTDCAEYTVGEVLSLANSGISQYPNQLRYGEHLCHYPALAVLNVVKELYKFTCKNKDNFYLPKVGEINHHEDLDYKTISVKTKKVAESYCKIIGGGLKISAEIDFREDKTIRDLDFWIGYKLLNYKSEVVGEIISGYVRHNGFKIFSQLEMYSETLESEMFEVIKPVRDKFFLDKEIVYKSKELETQMIKILKRAIKRLLVQRS